MTSGPSAPTQKHVEREREAAPLRPLWNPFEDAVTIAAADGPMEAEPAHDATEHPHRARHFVTHLIEMVLAMMIGMAALGAVWGAILTAYGEDVSAFKLHHAALFALVMALDMTVPMVWWMHLRGQDWARSAEMAGAMFVPTVLLIGLLQLGAVSGESLIGLQHALMLPAMLLVMLWRIDEYTRPHARVAAQAHQEGERVDRLSSGGWEVPGSPSANAARLLERFPGRDGVEFAVVVEGSSAKRTDAALERKLAAVARILHTSERARPRPA